MVHWKANNDVFLWCLKGVSKNVYEKIKVRHNRKIGLFLILFKYR